MTVVMLFYRLLRRSRFAAYSRVANHADDDVPSGPPAPSGPPHQHWTSLLFALARLGLIMAFFYLCDRSVVRWQKAGAASLFSSPTSKQCLLLGIRNDKDTFLLQDEFFYEREQVLFTFEFLVADHLRGRAGFVLHRR